MFKTPLEGLFFNIILIIFAVGMMMDDTPGYWEMGSGILLAAGVNLAVGVVQSFQIKWKML